MQQRLCGNDEFAPFDRLAKSAEMRHHRNMNLSDSPITKLLAASEAEQIERGYGHTLREIWQQPETWRQTSQSHDLLATIRQALAVSEVMARQGAIVLTGSGSSQYVGDCLALPLQSKLKLPVFSIPSGLLLTHLHESLPPMEPLLVVSVARSGNSPESVAVQQLVMKHRPQAHHLVLTCNAQGKLASEFAGHPKVHVAVLPEPTNDRSLVMTSSFTNLVLAGGLLGAGTELDRWRTKVRAMADMGDRILTMQLADIAQMPFRSVIFLGSGCHLGASREAALKMLEMTAGRIATMSESFLGFRHGPMSATSAETLVVAFLSFDPVVRAYEFDLLAELGQKKLGLRIVAFDANALDSPGPLPGVDFLPCPRPQGLPDNLEDGDFLLRHVVVGQLLAFFRCLHEGLKPDSPSESGIISRVVAPFRIH
ncbi:MAG: SIS domain-containing protein [Pirellulales bacterium]|nr:SIS domain-containing protein [Pirellulales bacterium]